jgi:glyoxylase-like metal-dependent hydrolase (beta-lactamase superfamily II)
MIERIGGGALGPILTDPCDGSYYVVRGQRRAVLVDAGCGARPARPPASVDAVLITHLHLDHAGGAASLAAAGLRVLAHPWTAEGLRAGDEERAGLPQARAHGIYPPELHLATCPSAEEVEDGAAFDLGGCRLLVLDTPGHSDGHLSFLVEDADGQRTLLAGDLVFAGGRVAVQALPDCRPERLRASLEYARAFEPHRLLAGHGEPVEHGATGHIDEALRHFGAGEVPPQLTWPP